MENSIDFAPLVRKLFAVPDCDPIENTLNGEFYIGSKDDFRKVKQAETLLHSLLDEKREMLNGLGPDCVSSFVNRVDAEQALSRGCELVGAAPMEKREEVGMSVAYALGYGAHLYFSDSSLPRDHFVWRIFYAAKSENDSYFKTVSSALEAGERRRQKDEE